MIASRSLLSLALMAVVCACAAQNRGALAWRAARAISAPPIVAGGAVWATDPGAGVLYAVDITNGATRFQRDLGAMQHFTTPTAYGDLILIAAGGRLVALRIR